MDCRFVAARAAQSVLHSTPAAARPPRFDQVSQQPAPQERTRHVNRIHKLLEETNIKLSSVFADLMCKTGRAILRALADGEERPAVLADLALLRAPHKRNALVPALQGCMRAHHRFAARRNCWA